MLLLAARTRDAVDFWAASRTAPRPAAAPGSITELPGSVGYEAPAGGRGRRRWARDPRCAPLWSEPARRALSPLWGRSPRPQCRPPDELSYGRRRGRASRSQLFCGCERRAPDLGG